MAEAPISGGFHPPVSSLGHPRLFYGCLPVGYTLDELRSLLTPCVLARIMNA